MTISEAEAKTKEYRELEKKLERITSVLTSTPSQVTVTVKGTQVDGSTINESIVVTDQWPAIADVLTTIGDETETAADTIATQF